jgi:hypothetical protein
MSSKASSLGGEEFSRQGQPRVGLCGCRSHLVVVQFCNNNFSFAVFTHVKKDTTFHDLKTS